MNLNLQAPINQLGYGVAGLNILKALQTQGGRGFILSYWSTSSYNQEDADAVRRADEKLPDCLTHKHPALKCGIRTRWQIDRSR